MKTPRDLVSRRYLMARALCMAVALLTGVKALGYGEADIAGAWADAGEPDKACLVITNSTAWVLKDGRWCPGIFGNNREPGGKFNLLGDEAEDRWDEVTAVAKWQSGAFAKFGVEIKEGDIYWGVIERKGNSERMVAGRKIIRCAMPDWNKIRQDKAYLGSWKPVRTRRFREEKAGAEVEDALRLKVREDGIAIFYYPKAETTSEQPEPYRIERVIPVDGGMRFDFREQYRNYPDPLNCMYQAMWLDREDRLHVFKSDEHITFVRTQEEFPDPIDARREMVRDCSYHGVWGVSSEFNILVISLDRSGKGVLSVFMGMLPFSWKCGKDGEIICTPDPDVALLSDWSGGDFVCRFAPESNQMTVTFPNMADTDQQMESKTIKFMSAEVHVDEVFQRLEEAKNNPEWEVQLQRAKDRRATQTNK